MRAFVAVDVPAVVVDGSSTGSDAQPAHITLQFLGDTPDSQVGEVSQAIARVAAETAPIDVDIQGVGAFPTPQRPRVVWVGVGRGSQRLVDLALRVGVSLTALGFPPGSRAFLPHVTLFRIRSPSDAQRARALLAGPPTGPLASGVIQELLLKESHLASGGTTHRVVARSTLRGPKP